MIDLEKRKQYLKTWYQKNKIRKKENLKIVKDTPEFKQKRSFYNKKYRGKYKDQLAEYYKENRDKILIRSRNYTYKRDFGITIEDYNKLLELQNNNCSICKISDTEYNKRFSVDHDHKTGKVRGLLCHKCNSVLGFVNDSQDILQECITYLKKSHE